ncbi:MAG: hydroxymethylpyrimidine/phosphomethylpyrimidine kinase, partial [Acidovorax sp.]
IIPARMCWAQAAEEDGDEDEPLDETQAIEGWVMPPHDTKH